MPVYLRPYNLNDTQAVAINKLYPVFVELYMPSDKPYAAFGKPPPDISALPAAIAALQMAFDKPNVLFGKLPAVFGKPPPDIAALHAAIAALRVAFDELHMAIDEPPIFKNDL